MEENVDQKVLDELINNVAEVTGQLEQLVLANLERLQVPELDDGIKIMADLMNILT
jgi:predicted translin family RNA/ssDNA-binding protein